MSQRVPVRPPPPPPTPAGGGGRPCNSLALFDPDTGAWEAPSAEGWRPSPRESHSACCTSSALT